MRKLTSYVFIDAFDEYVDNDIVDLIQHYLEKELNFVKLESNQLSHIIDGYEFDNRAESFTLYAALFTSDPMIQ